jgi:redox-sensing transcriptional repressor
MFDNYRRGHHDARAHMDKPVPASVLRRLTRYLVEVQALDRDGVEWVSSRDLAEALGLTSSTVRQDLSHIAFSGISKRGYATQGLGRELSRVLGADTAWSLLVVGAGNLGRALAQHEDFARRGFTIRGIFDNDPRKIGKKVGKLTVRALRELPAAVGEHRADIGVIAVPNAAAQSVADLLIVAGIRGLLNLTLAHIIAPARVAVVDSRIVTSLLELSHAVLTRRAGESVSLKT